MAKKEAAWKQNQQKKTKSQDKEQSAQERGTKTDLVELYMTSDYRDQAKAGQVWMTDAEKAAELIKLNRAQAYDPENEQHATAPRAN